MKRIIITLCLFFAMTPMVNAEFYICVDKDGNTILTDSPPYGAKCESRGGDRESIQERTSNIQGRESEYNRRLEDTQSQRERQQELQERRQREIQDARNREADRLEEAAKKHIPGSHGMTAAQRNQLNNAARIRLGLEPESYSGEEYEAVKGGAINPRTGDFYPDVGGGVIHPKSGEFMHREGGVYVHP